MNIYVFGNGNLSFIDFKLQYETILNRFLDDDRITFSICDFRGVDTLTMELLKCRTKNVIVFHMNDAPRYMPDVYKTEVSSWKMMGGFESDVQRDLAVINACTHYVAFDFNSNDKRKSGTLKNMEICERLGKLRLNNE